MTRSIILEINPKIKVLYYLSAVTIMGNYSYEQELFAFDKDAFNSYTNEINKYYKDVRLLSLLSDYYKKNDVESIPGFILITYSSYLEKLSREKLEGLGHLISAGFHIDVALNDNNQIKRERISDWGIMPLPIWIKSYMECIVSELINKVYRNGRNSDDNIFGITIGKFVPELKGEVSISANYLLNKRYEISEDDIFLLFRFLLDKLEKYEKSLVKSLILSSSLRAACAAIMGRNMSHNIGSHVLARLTNAKLANSVRGQDIDMIRKRICINDNDNNEGKAKDRSENSIKDIIDLSKWSDNMQIFLRYLQQRQDYIATISTEWPGWTDSVYFLRDVMQWFLQQKHLLDNIAASENLAAHSYDNQSNKSDIRFHIFLCHKKNWEPEPGNLTLSERKDMLLSNKSKKEKYKSILLYTDKDEEILSPEKDLLIGITGGIIGYHAFYVIIENIIRNAAKHCFERSMKDHLDIVIEILNDPNEEIGINKRGKKYSAFLFRIYDNVSLIRNKQNDDGIILWGKNKEKGLNDKLGESLLDETAKLKKENWGLAEIKISAAYLEGLEIDRLGIAQGSICGDPKYSLKSLAESSFGSSAIIRAVESPLGTLGYEFFVLKPRLVGIHCNKEAR